MAVLFTLIQMETVASAVTFLAVLAVLVGLGYRWRFRPNDDNTEESEQAGTGAGFPLASWRYVYDVDKADANREIASVQQQAEDLSEADKKSRR